MGPCRPRVELALQYTTPSQSEISRSVGLGINSGDIRVPSLVVGVVYVWMDYDRGMGPYCSQMTVTLCTIPGQ